MSLFLEYLKYGIIHQERRKNNGREKNKKKKISASGIIVGIIIATVLGFAVYIISGFIIEQFSVKTIDQTGSPYIGKYKEVWDSWESSNSGPAPTNNTMELCEDGSYKENGSKNRLFIWQETENGFAITYYVGREHEFTREFIETAPNCYRMLNESGTYVDTWHYEKIS